MPDLDCSCIYFSRAFPIPNHTQDTHILRAQVSTSVVDRAELARMLHHRNEELRLLQREKTQSAAEFIQYQQETRYVLVYNDTICSHFASTCYFSNISNSSPDDAPSKSVINILCN